MYILIFKLLALIKIDELITQGSILTQMDHPNIPKYYNSFIYNNKYYIVSEYIKSPKNLAQEVESNIILKENSVKLIISQLVSVLKYCKDKIPGIHLNLNLECINFVESENNSYKYQIFVKNKIYS